MPSVYHHSFGRTARPWQDVVQQFAENAEEGAWLTPMSKLVAQIADSPFAEQGLYPVTSMYDLIVAQSRDVFGNPNLRIRWNPRESQFKFDFQDGTLKPWVRVCREDEAFEVLSRFLTKRARWFREANPEISEKG